MGVSQMSPSNYDLRETLAPHIHQAAAEEGIFCSFGIFIIHQLDIVYPITVFTFTQLAPFLKIESYFLYSLANLGPKPFK